MFRIITESGDFMAYTRKDTIREARKHINAGCKVVMIETPTGFIVSVEDLEEVEGKLTNM